MIGGYETIKAGVCPFEGTKTRRFLNAPVSLDFKHSIGAINARVLRLRDQIHVVRMNMIQQRATRFSVKVSLPVVCLLPKQYTFDVPEYVVTDKRISELINAQLNDLADVAAKEARIPVFATLMRRYNHDRLHYFACNHERFMLDSVNQNI